MSEAAKEREDASGIFYYWKGERPLNQDAPQLEGTGELYKTRAEDRGFVFVSTMSISESGGGITLTSSHDSKPQGIVAKLLSLPMVFLFKGVAKKALLQDLNDIKAAVEQE